MRKLKFKQFNLILCVTLSLLVSLMPSCACSHHQPKIAETAAAVENNKSCHSAAVSEETASEMPRAEAESGETIQRLFTSGDCYCVESAAPKIYVKPETVNPDNQLAAIFPATRFEKISAPRVVNLTRIDFAPPFYLSDSFYNLTPGRAPPARL